MFWRRRKRPRHDRETGGFKPPVPLETAAADAGETVLASAEMRRAAAIHQVTGIEEKPYRAVIDFLDGTTKRKDAVSFAKAFIDQRFANHDVCWWHVRKFDGGWLFEVHEGGPGKSYIKSAMEAIDADPQVVCVVPMTRRVMEVKRSFGGAYSSVVLPEGQPASGERQHHCVAGAAMAPYRDKGEAILNAGIGLAAAGIIAFAATLVFYLSDQSVADRSRTEIAARYMPVQRWIELTTSPEPLLTYVSRISFTRNAQGRGFFTIDRPCIRSLSQPECAEVQARLAEPAD